MFHCFLSCLLFYFLPKSFIGFVYKDLYFFLHSFWGYFYRLLVWLLVFFPSLFATVGWLSKSFMYGRSVVVLGDRDFLCHQAFSGAVIVDVCWDSGDVK